MLPEALRCWCESLIGPYDMLSDHTREHPGLRAGSLRLRGGAGDFFLKIHRDRSHWEQEAHGYEHWARAFGSYAPRLVGVRAGEPLAILVSALPGTPLEDTALAAEQETEIWRSAGQALAGLHALQCGDSFGPCRRDGSPVGLPARDAPEYVRGELEDWTARGLRGGWLSAAEHAFLRDALSLAPAFAGVRPTACHRDYCPANWLVSAQGEFAGVIDFEFAYWDVPTADFTRDPTWRWMARPDTSAAFFAGYGRVFSAAEEEQIRFSRIVYAAGALVWGMENEYSGFAREGREALARLAKM